MDIVLQKQSNNHSHLNDANGNNGSQVYLVSKPANKYEEVDDSAEEKAPRLVMIRVMDVLFEDQLCSLVYMRELNNENNATNPKQTASMQDKENCNGDSQSQVRGLAKSIELVTSKVEVWNKTVA